MNVLSTIHEITQDLEQHENSKRIKKLIFCACKNIWENDQNKLDQFKFSELIQELCNLNPTLEHLNYNLSQIVNTLNKPDEYAILANFVVNKIEKIYAKDQEETGILNHHNHLGEKHKKQQIKHEYNQFDLRQNIMQYTNPLRAKIVLFSAVYHKFHFKSEDWSKLRLEELDNLLWRLFDSCANIKEAESKVNNSVISLGNEDENIQAASTIIRFMQNLYGDISSNNNQYQQSTSSLSTETRPLVNPQHQILTPNVNIFDENDNYENDFDDNNTCQVIVPPNNKITNNK